MKAVHFFLLLIIIILTGCSSAYIPSPKNIPLFENKGEGQIEVGASTNSLYLTGSYAFSEKFAMITNGSISYPAIAGQSIRHYNELTIFTDGDVPHSSFEVGIGRYNLLPSSESRLEVFLGTGYGKSYSFFSKDDRQNYMQGFAQINTGKRFKHAEIGWSMRMAFSGFQYQDGYYKASTYPSEYIIEHGKYQTFHLEPLFVIRVGGQHVKWFARTGLNLAFPLSSNSLIQTRGTDPGYTILHLSTGISYRFPNALRSTKQNNQLYRYDIKIRNR